MSSAFPLLRLPENALELVIECMDYVDIVGFSLVSHKTKEIVRSLYLDIGRLVLTVNDIIRIRSDPDRDGPSSMVWSFYPEEDNAGPVPIPVYMPARVTGMRDLITHRNFVEYQNPCLSIQEWVEHFQYLFSIEEIDYISFANETCKFDWTSLKDALGKFNINTLFFHNFCGLDCAQKALKQFSSVTSVTAFSPSFNDPSHYSNILIQNLDTLSLGHENMALKIGLDDLLLMNSKAMSIQSPTLTDKMLNQFFKHWIKGSNPRMDVAHFAFVNDQVVNKEIILKDLHCQEVPLDDVRDDGEVTEKYNIMRKGGSVGTITIQQTDEGYDVFFQQVQ
ncbi:hypothetical protein CRE_23668 [Caenorhabditis remanei]|uniref:F-box domain-containing protein n=1 Tax=Caenorhabditis remanei TaxID=31234 RepID=E3N482_CAERE|nr:hypothetical protein CRE_23668 [Caenorhabditis remanei]